MIRSAAIACAIPSKSPGDEMPSVRMITCLSLATVDRSVSCASSIAGAITVPPPASSAGDPVEDEALVGARVHLADPEVLALEGQHADLVAGPQQLDGRPGRLLGHLDLLAAHRARLVDHQHHRQARLLLLLLEVAADRQDLFQARLVIAAQAERLVAAQHDQPAAQVLHVGAGHLHLPQAERRGRHV